MFNPRGIFSPDYNSYLARRDNIKSLVIQARENLRGSTLFGEKIDTTNPEDLIATLYVLYRDYEMFHERF